MSVDKKELYFSRTYLWNKDVASSHVSSESVKQATARILYSRNLRPFKDVGPSRRTVTYFTCRFVSFNMWIMRKTRYTYLNWLPLDIFILKRWVKQAKKVVETFCTYWPLI